MCTIQNNNQVSKEDKQLVILILLILAIISCHPCLSQIAIQLNVQVYSLVRIISVIMFVVAVMIIKFTGGKGDKNNAKRRKES